MYGISRKKSWWGTETTRTQGNMLPDWTFVDRSALVQHLTTETQRLHPDRCARPVCGMPAGTPAGYTAMNRLCPEPYTPHADLRLSSTCALRASPRLLDDLWQGCTAPEHAKQKHHPATVC